MPAINWMLRPGEKPLIDAIVKRAHKRLGGDKLAMAMDITATHLNGTPLDLAALLAADGFDFLHDIVGICRHIDRRTGKLGDCFYPRYARHEPSGKRRSLAHA